MKISIKDQNYYNTINSCKDNGTTGVEYVRTLIDKSYENGIEACKQLYEEKLRWIPVEEKDAPTEIVQMKLQNGEIRFGYFTDKIKTTSSINKFIKVTHYRTLSFYC